MPELPEVETTRRGIAPHVEGHRVSGVTVRQRQLRWPVPKGLGRTLAGQRLESVERRGKYLLLRFERGTVIIHLGMSGSLRLVPEDTPAQKHDHVDIAFDTGRILRLHDPRRFGAVLHTRGNPLDHELLAHLGPEPLGTGFDGAHLFQLSRNRRAPVKAFIMDSKIVVGVGNIYASEALFLAGIHPRRPAGRIGAARYDRLAASIRDVLTAAIRAGGTTLRDFTDSNGRPGYFARHLHVYGREGEPCPGCGIPIRQEVIAQRASYYCPACQR